MENFKLSIVVPTYNGGQWIKDTLESVLVQLEEYSSLVEFIVRDNSSSDNTESIVLSLNQKYNNLINYNRREKTAIADVNFRESVLLAKGEYIVLLGDDDLLFPRFIENTLDIINEHPNIGLIYYNRISTTRDYNGASLKHLNPNNSFSRLYESVEDFIADYPTGPDFMSVNVVKRECIMKGIPNTKDKYYGVEWYYAELYGIQGYKCISLFYPMILQRVPEKRVWNDRALLYVFVGVDNMFSDISNIYPTALNSWRGYAKNHVSKLRNILMSIPMNPSLYSEKWDELREKLNWFQRLIAKTLIVFPFLSKFLRYALLGPLTIFEIFISPLKKK